MQHVSRSVRSQILMIAALGALGLFLLAVVFSQIWGRLVDDLSSVDDLLVMEVEVGTIANLVQRARLYDRGFRADPTETMLDGFAGYIEVAVTKIRGNVATSRDDELLHLFAEAETLAVAYHDALSGFARSVRAVTAGGPPADGAIDLESEQRNLDKLYARLNESLAAVRNALQRKAERALTEARDFQGSGRSVVIFGSLALILLIVPGSFMVAHKLSGRFNLLNKALNKLVRGEDVQVIPLLDDPSEVGQVARFLEAYHRRSRELEQAKADAEQASRAKSRFLAHMSHELRTPLNGILGFAQMIQMNAQGPRAVTTGPERFADYAGFIREAGEHLLQLISDILDISKIEVGRLELAESEIRLSEVTAAAARVLSERARAQGISVTTDFAALDPTVRGDERLLKQVALNLLSNALKYSPGGSTVSLTLTADAAGHLVWSFRDQGPGIPASQIQRVMQPFEQAHQNPEVAQEGTGLGLSIASAFVKHHGGDLQIASRVGEGTVVRVVLPRERIVAETRAIAACG